MRSFADRRGRRQGLRPRRGGGGDGAGPSGTHAISPTAPVMPDTSILHHYFVS
jgi:hypothetical protein